jgi:phosphatidate cytidylyltransferase
VLLYVFLMMLSFFASREIHALLLVVTELGERKGSLLWFVIPSLLIITSGYTIHFVNFGVGAMLYTGILCLLFPFAGLWAVYGRRRGFRYALLSGAGFLYCGVSPLLILLLRNEERGFLLICFLFLAAWINDASAYFIGSYFGRTRGIIRYSPNKSLEGYVAAFVITLIVVNGFKLLAGASFPPSLLQTNLLGLCIAMLAPLGDLGESVFKRKTGVKDSSGMVPGMGGVLDVFDSVLISVPAYFILVKILI